MPLSKNISCFGIAFTASVTVDIFERDIKRLAMRAQLLPLLPACFFTPPAATASK
jgi:hypothetical protein